MPGPSDGPMTRKQFHDIVRTPMGLRSTLQWIMEKPDEAEGFGVRKGFQILEGFPSIRQMILVELSFREQADLICHGFWVVQELEKAGKEVLVSAALHNILAILKLIKDSKRYHDFPTARALLSVIAAATCNLINKGGRPSLDELIIATGLLKRI